jgi:hypothetical protein
LSKYAHRRVRGTSSTSGENGIFMMENVEHRSAGRRPGLEVMSVLGHSRFTGRRAGGHQPCGNPLTHEWGLTRRV